MFILEVLDKQDIFKEENRTILSDVDKLCCMDHIFQMPKVTKRKASQNDAPKRNSIKNEIPTQEEDQPVVTTVDKTEESTGKKGVKRKASSTVEKVRIILINP